MSLTSSCSGTLALVPNSGGLGVDVSPGEVNDGELVGVLGGGLGVDAALAGIGNDEPGDVLDGGFLKLCVLVYEKLRVISVTCRVSRAVKGLVLTLSSVAMSLAECSVTGLVLTLPSE